MPPVLPPVVNVFLSMSGIAGTVLFILFMRKLSQYIGRIDLAARARNVLIALALLFPLAAVVAFVMIGAAFAGAIAVGLIGLVPMLCALIVFVMYANLINALRKALGQR